MMWMRIKTFGVGLNTDDNKNIPMNSQGVRQHINENKKTLVYEKGHW